LKILQFNVREDDIGCIIETRSISLEYLALSRLQKVYEEFIESFPTTLKEDFEIMRESREKLTGREWFAMIYRTEMKKVLMN